MICKYCNSGSLIKKGKVKTKFSEKQIYLCKDCGKKFVETSIPNKTYSARIIYDAVSNYNLHNTMKRAVALTNKKYKTKLSTSTLHGWLKEYKLLTPYLKLRQNFIKNYDAKELLTKKTFEHNGLQYNFKFHNAKLNHICTDEKFSPLKEYLQKLINGCPDFFGKNKRCSNLKVNVITQTGQKYNLACKMTNFALRAAANNKERHSVIEKFMLLNDTCTIAVEVPVWFWEKTINDGVSGHIDVLQIRNRLVYILDYKPNAKQDRKASGQLYLYARALSLRLNMKFEDFRCAWFDEESYFEFNPSLSVRKFEKTIIPNLIGL